MLLTEQDQRLWIGVPSESSGIALSEDGLHRHRNSSPPQVVDWAEIKSVRMQAKVSMWRHPRAASWVMNLGAALVDIWSPGSPPVVHVVVRTREGASVLGEASAHYLTGYVRGEIEAVDELLRLLVADPKVRPRLADPTDVLSAVEQAARDDQPARALRAALADVRTDPVESGGV